MKRLILILALSGCVGGEPFSPEVCEPVVDTVNVVTTSEVTDVRCPRPTIRTSTEK